MGASPGEGDLLTCVKAGNPFINKLAAVIRIDPQDGKREQHAGALQGCNHRLLPTVEQRETLRPPSSDIRKGECVEETPLKMWTAMGDQIHFQKARLGLIPVRKGTNRDLL